MTKSMYKKLSHYLIKPITTMSTYTYYTRHEATNLPIKGTVEARHSFEALHNARLEAMKCGASIRLILISKND